LGCSYPAIEVAALLVAIWAAMEVDGAVLWATCVLGWALLALAVIDWHHHLLPDELTIPLIPAGLVTIYLIDGDALPAHAVGAGAGFLSAIIVRQLYFWFRGREGLGLGDAKLLAAAGAWVSWVGLPTVVFVGAMMGLTVVSLTALRARTPSLSDRVPFGTYLCAGIWLVWLYGPFSFV
jgi:leader peptidase (prepilin peptidase)/N-methyltransferase